MLRSRSFLFAATIAFLAAPPVFAHPEKPQTRTEIPKVTLNCLREPLSAILGKLTDPAHKVLSLERDLSDQKMVVIVHGRPADEVRERIAEVLGSRWVALGKAEECCWRLERDPEVRA